MSHGRCSTLIGGKTGVGRQRGVSEDVEIGIGKKSSMGACLQSTVRQNKEWWVLTLARSLSSAW
ncbi:hypothetical protein N7466_002968 [Penicillium verhagenii]|uniref:uncharacterized protein n=1 Tax=Penicillium verhagenii TaxID=1562060 RepID=UPI002544FC53|nr:uncharacterized protein N7466_002968 [Penicillium verhagenii]KAJ5936518.1 hypothetical protein N7466_002968 [Penicillium verhagenii]